MFYRIFASALVAGVLAGLFVSVLQQFTTVPIIVQAESYESAPAAGDSHAHGPGEEEAHDHGGGWAPADGGERIFYTALSSVLIAAGWGLLLVALIALSGRRIDGKTGVLWGAAGFVATALAPGAGLPPELPGTMAAEVTARQVWWVATLVATGAALWLLVLARATIWKGAGVLLLIVPHAVGAPQPDHFGGAVPPELAAHFVATSLAVSAAFWVLLGWLAGAMWDKLEPSGD
ncbi:MAG: hypothetical protein TEF_16840 [Rhizobiales bacterium NRL2]|jgi:cobalt transporter subunit CbtA|nr:MAG: hypothetical protein TEF_16840 [Rhizobiales bacterium NRL2]